MPDRIWLGQFNIVGGQVQEQGPFAAATANRSVADGIADLYITLQPGGPDRNQLCADILQTAGRMFGRTQYSITGNLLLALGTAHQRLVEWNRSSIPEDRLSVGVSCLAIAGEDAYLAQAGPSTVYYRHNGLVERLEPLDAEARTPLGEGETVAPWFHRLTLACGDTLLLVSGGLGARLGQQRVEHCLSLSPESGLPEVFRLARGEQDCGAILIGVLEDPAQDDEDEHEDRDETGEDGGEDARVLPARRVPTPQRAAAPPISVPRERGTPERDLPLPEPPREPERPRRTFPSPLGRIPFRRLLAPHPDRGRGVVRIQGAEIPRGPLVGPAHALASADAVLSATGRPPAAKLRFRSQHPGFRNAFRSLERRRRSLRPFVLGGATVALLAIALYLGIPALSSTGRSQRFQSLLTSAQSELTTARAEPDLSRRRVLLNQALTNADEAKRLRPDDQRAAVESDTVAGDLSVMDAVYTLPDVPVLADLSRAGLSSSSAVEVAAGDRYYVLDVAAGKVLAVTGQGGDDGAIVYEDGSSIDGVRAGKAHHIAWQPSTGPGDPGTLLILDAGRHLFGLSHGDLRGIALRGIEQWRTDTAMAFASGNLYLLDAAAGLVWRYTPSDSGFDTDPAPAVARADIRDSTNVSVVGGIFLTGTDGRIRRFLDGQESSLKLAGIDRPPAAPAPPLLDPSTDLLYIADRGNSRVIVLEGDGRFKRQLVHARLSGLRGLVVDTANSRLVGVIGQSLVGIPIPR